MSKAALHKRDTVHRFALWALITVELLMSFSFLGYIHVEPISITTAYIPVLLAGALLGPADSAILGLVFGLASMWKASANYVMEADHLFSPLFSGYPLGSIMLSVGGRIFHHAGCGAHGVSCSLGALRITDPALQPEELYLRADRLLYEAKSLGRGRYVIG